MTDCMITDQWSRKIRTFFGSILILKGPGTFPEAVKNNKPSKTFENNGCNANLFNWIRNISTPKQSQVWHDQFHLENHRVNYFQDVTPSSVSIWKSVKVGSAVNFFESF